MKKSDFFLNLETYELKSGDVELKTTQLDSVVRSSFRDAAPAIVIPFNVVFLTFTFR